METTMNFCRVCLVPDEEGEFTSIFANNGKYAKKIHFLTGVQPIQIARKIPALICANCARDVDAANSLRLQILDADDYFLVLSHEIETKYWKNQRAAFNKTRLEPSKRAIAVKSTARVYNAPPITVIKQEVPDPDYDDSSSFLLPMDAEIKKQPSPISLNKKRKMSVSPEVAPSPPISVTTTTSIFSKRHRKMPSKFDSSFVVEKILKRTKPPPKRLSASSSGSECLSGTPPSELSRSDITFECGKCKISFDDIVKFNYHLAIHQTHEPYACFFCPLTFRDYSQRIKHMQTNHLTDLRKRYVDNGQSKVENIQECVAEEAVNRKTID